LASSKEIPAWLLGADKSYREAFLKGYCLTDVWSGQTNYKVDVKEAVTVSKKLAFSLKSLILSLGFNPTLYCRENNTSVIEGRNVKTLPSYKINWREKVDRKHSQTFISKELFYSAIKENKEYLNSVTVYNIGVKEDKSYIVEGIIVHSC
jgi:intein/homing endonuclease